MPHSLLARQLKRLGLGQDPPTTQQWHELLRVIETTYRDAEQDREMVERAMTISSAEMRELYEDLERSSRERFASQRAQLLATDAVKAAVLEASPDGILVIGEQREVVMCNRRFLEIWGIPEHVLETGRDQELLAVALQQLVDPEAFGARIAQLYAEPRASSEDEIALVDGRVLERFSRPMVDAEGIVRGRLWSFRDVTARRQNDAKLRSAHAFLDSIFEALPHMVFVKDARELRFVQFNRAGEQLLGIPRDQLIGRSDHDLFPASQADGFVAADRGVLASGKVTTISEEQLQTATGIRYLRTRKMPIYDHAEHPAYLLGISEDITEERKQSAELYLAKERAETASRAKSDFLLNMSHELRTPLNSILGFSRVVARSPRLDDDEREYLRDIVVAGEHMLQLINDLLDLRSLEAHALEVTPTELLPPLHEAIRMVQPLAREREQTLSVDIGPQLPPCLGERRAIVQVLVNLMTNATKFTPRHGRVEVRARDDHDMIQLEVADTGCGISPADQERLFHYFEQLGAKHQHSMKGSGVGLALTRALVEKMGGTISVTSALGEGTTFAVRLRCAAP